MKSAHVFSVIAIAFAASACSSPSTSGSSADDPSTPDPADAAVAALPSAKATSLSVGAAHACALTTEGAVRCWGYSDKGEIGNGAPYDTTRHAVPVQVTGLTAGVKVLSAGDDFSCVVTSAGGVKCWGNNDGGQLGTGIVYTDSSMQASNVPVDVKGITSGATAVSAGGDHACAIVGSGSVKCWGHDEYGKLGNNSTHSPGDDQPSFLPPVDVIGITNAVQISVGGGQSCAVLATGALKCWGSNTWGELGIGTEDPSKRVPVDVSALGTDVAYVAAGPRQTCVIMKTGALKCWGEGDSGDLGDGMTGIIRNVRLPGDVLGVSAGATSISANGFSCAVISGATKCWGKSADLGYGEPGFETYAPAAAAVGLESGSQRVEVGNAFACALTTAGAIECWGTNDAGNLGNGLTDAVRVSQPAPVISFP